MKPAVRVILVIVFVIVAIIAWRVLPATRSASEPVATDAVAVMDASDDAPLTTASDTALADASVAEAPAADAPPVAVTYTCGDVAAELTMQGSDNAVLDVAGDVYHLSRSVSASGEKFETATGIDPRALFWVKGDEALLEVSGKDDRTCTVNKQLPLPSAQNGAIEGIEWRATELNHRPLAADVSITVTLDGAGRIAGRSGCNRYTGPYAIDTAARSLTVTGPVAGTRMACAAPAAMAAEDTFNAVLPKITAYQLEDGPVLVIYAGSDDVLRLTPASAQ